MVKLVYSYNIRISIISYDTDVFILLVHSCLQELLNYELLTSSGISVIDIKVTSEHHRAPVHIISSRGTVSRMYGIWNGKAPEDGRQLELENLNNSYIPIDQVIEEASKCVLDCHRTRETNMSSVWYDIWTSRLAKKKTAISPYNEGVTTNH